MFLLSCQSDTRGLFLYTYLSSRESTPNSCPPALKLLSKMEVCFQKPHRHVTIGMGSELALLSLLPVQSPRLQGVGRALLHEQESLSFQPCTHIKCHV